jgi:hypothetical protein
MQAVRNKVGSRSIVSNTLAMLLCFVSGMTGISFLFEGNFRVRAAPYKQNGVEKLSPPTMNRPGLISFGHAPAKVGPSKDHVWSENQSRGKRKSVAETGTAQTFYRELSLNAIAQREVLRRAPMEFTKAAKQTQVVMTLPMPDGTFSRFRIEESPVLAPLLAARFPAIKTYRGRGLDDPTATTRFDVTPAGFHAIVLSTQGTIIIEPEARERAGQYVSYHQQDAPKGEASFNCLVSGAEQSLAQPAGKQVLGNGYTSLDATTGTTLRTYRLALAATAEYTQQYGGGTVAGALGALTTTINAVDAIYERDLAIHLMLIDNETSIIFTNAATDGYTSDDVNLMLGQNQTILDLIVGSANYDVGMVLDGHVYAYQPGHFIFQGAGQFQSVCGNGSKGKGVSIFRSIEPSTTTAIYVVAHELGHMFGALHTFNGTLDDCGPSRFAQVAYEPGSGSTIMAYRGGVLPNGTYFPICGAEELFSNDTYFHTASIEQIVNYTTFGNGSFCPLVTSTENNPPNVDAGLDYTIPANTPFALTATASDSEDGLTYCWEEYDLGSAGPPDTDNGNRPIFRSFAPVETPVRTFPQLSDILSGAPTFGESLPATTRTMNFRVTVRDNHSGGGGVNTGAMRVNVVSSSGPFAITQPSSSTTWVANSTQTVTWNVANTSAAPINCLSVRILLSIDGGNAFPVVLSSSRPNNGAATVIIPNMPTSTARIKIEAVDNIFFNISLPNFTITPDNTAAPTLLIEGNTNRAIALDSVTFLRDPFPLATINNFSLDQRTRVTLFVVGLELLPGEDVSVVTAQAEDAGHKIFPLKVEYVGKVPGFDWLTQVVIRLPDDFLNAGDVFVSVSLRGAVSNKVVIGIR